MRRKNKTLFISLIFEIPLKFILQFFFRNLQYGCLHIQTPSGQLWKFEGKKDRAVIAVWHLHNWKPFWAIVTRGSLGFGESYIHQDWSTPDLKILLSFAATNEKQLDGPKRRRKLLRLGDIKSHKGKINSKKQARKNIAYHYDLGNSFYALWLDETMTYSSALFQGKNVTLKEAQECKYQRILDVLDVQPGSSLLEIGCGWGGFLEHAANQTEASILGVSISQAQTDYALKRLHRKSVRENVNIEICDYRDVKGSFDHIVSIEMFEAVGREYWNTYAQKLKNLLSTNGTAVLQVITIEEERFDSYSDTPDYIQRYIFPGGMLPSYSVLESTFAESGLQIIDSISFGNDYAKTLSLWRDQFLEHWPSALELGFDESFRRMWEFYLVYCETGFQQKSTDVVQITLTHI